MPPLFDSADLLSNLPNTRALVRAGVLAVGLASATTVGCGDLSPAPTCGVCCHVPDDPSCQDAGPVDSGPVEAGPADSGPIDSGPIDSGPIDAGPVDAGAQIGPTCGPCCHGGPGCDGGL